MKAKTKLVLTLTLVVITIVGFNVWKSERRLPPQGVVEHVSGRYTTNTDGTIDATITAINRMPIRVKDGDYEVSYLTGTYPSDKGPTFRFGLSSVDTGEDLRELNPTTFTFKKDSFISEGCKVRISNNGSNLERIADAPHGPDYKGPFMKRPDWAQPIAAR